MTYLRSVVVGCFLSVSVMVTARGEDQPPRSIVTTCPVTKIEAGRYTMAPFQDTLVLLDARTGRTWLLTKQDGEPAAWAPIVGAVGEVAGKAELESRSSTHGGVGEVEIKFIPEMRGPIILGRSKKKDAATTDSQPGNATDGYRSYDEHPLPSEDR